MVGIQINPEDLDEDKTQEQSALRKIPVAITSDWGGLAQQAMTGAALPPSNPFPPSAPDAKRRQKIAAMPSPMAPPPPAFGGMAPGAPVAEIDYLSLSGEGSGDDEVGASFSLEKGKGGGGGNREGFFSRLLGGKKKSKKRPDLSPMEPVEKELVFAQLEVECQEECVEDEPFGAIQKEQRKSSPDLHFDLLMTQKANGAFPESDCLKQWLGGSWEKVQGIADKVGMEVICTMIALMLLKEEASFAQDEWMLAVEKAEQWLGKQSKPNQQWSLKELRA